MATDLTDRDYQLLNAYIDGELSNADRMALEIRLDAEPQLRRELEELQATVNLLAGLPLRKAPRDFTLQPAAGDASARPTRPARWLIFPTAPAFSALSAAAALVLMIFGGLLLAVDPDGFAGDRAPQAAPQLATVTLAGPATATTRPSPTAAVARQEADEVADAPPTEAETAERADDAALLAPSPLPTEAIFMVSPEQVTEDATVEAAAGMAPAPSPTLMGSPVPTAAPSPMPTVPPPPASLDTATPDDLRALGAAGAIGIGLLLLLIALGTTLARQRRHA